MNRKKIFVWTHADLDGLVSCLVVKWAHPNHDFEYLPVSGFGIREDVTKWMLKHNFSDYERVFVVDLDVSENADLFDKPNVFIVDHHKSHVENGKYKQAVAIIKEYPSACLLLYKVFKKLYDIKLSKQQKTLILLGNDYDSYTLAIPESKMLNTIFWETQKNFETLTKFFDNGFQGFTKQQLAICEIHKRELQQAIEKLKLFENKSLKISKKSVHVIATFASTYINEIADYILETFNPDIALIVNLSSKHVSFRRNKKSDVKLHKLAEKIADGGGHEYSAGGFTTDTFIEFTKLLTPL